MLVGSGPSLYLCVPKVKITKNILNHISSEHFELSHRFD